MLKEEKPLEWAALWDAMLASPERWQRSTPAMFDEMLNVLPPVAMGGGAFLAGEPNHHNAEGAAVYACFYAHAGIVEARYMTRAEFSQFRSMRGQ